VHPACRKSLTAESGPPCLRFPEPTPFARALVLSWWALMQPAPATSQEFSPGVQDELRLLKEETVTTPIRHEQPISEAPSNVYVITDEDIRHSGAVDLPTLLRRVPGLEVMQMTGADFNVSARGDNQVFANKLLVLVDGRSIYVDVQGSVFWKTIPVTLPEIKRIEVVKGPIEALYGFNAFDGVINIITKSPDEIKGTTLQVGGGEFGTLTSAAIHADTQGKLGYRLSIGEDQTQQWDDRRALAFRAYKFNVHTEYALDEASRLVVSGGLVDANRFDGPITDRVGLNGTFTDGYATIGYERRNGFVRAWWREFDTAADFRTHPGLAGLFVLTDRNGRPIGAFVNNSYNIEAQHAVEVGEGHRVTYGVNYRHNSLSSTIIDRYGREDRLGAYLQGEWQVTRPVRLVTGVRYDLHTEINPTVSPRVSLLYTPIRDQTFRATLSVAYRPPTLLETHLDTRAVLPGPVVTTGMPTSNLNPEQIVSYEVGYQGWFLRHRLRLRADLFLNHISDLIAVRTPTATTAVNVNEGEADIYGGEAGVEFLATSWLTGFANYAYQEVGQTFTTRAQRGAPRFKVNAGLRAEWGNGISAEALLHHYGAAVYPIDPTFATLAPFGAVVPDGRVGSYNLLNLRVAYRFWREKVELAVSAFNALNDKHREHPLGEVIGSRVMTWLTAKLW
jgi:iron complex outermembrane receptor protein